MSESNVKSGAELKCMIDSFNMKFQTTIFLLALSVVANNGTFVSSAGGTVS
jgi:hypothetical protein